MFLNISPPPMSPLSSPFKLLNCLNSGIIGAGGSWGTGGTFSGSRSGLPTMMVLPLLLVNQPLLAFRCSFRGDGAVLYGEPGRDDIIESEDGLKESGAWLAPEVVLMDGRPLAAEFASTFEPLRMLRNLRMPEIRFTCGGCAEVIRAAFGDGPLEPAAAAEGSPLSLREGESLLFEP